MSGPSDFLRNVIHNPGSIHGGEGVAGPQGLTMYKGSPGGPTTWKYLKMGAGADSTSDRYFTLLMTWSHYHPVMILHPAYKKFEPLPNPLDFIKVVDIPGKGKGLVATRDLPADRAIFFERPLLVMMYNMLESIVNDFDAVVVSKMHPKARDAFEHLHNCKPRGPGLSEYLGKLRSNAFGIESLFEDDQPTVDSIHQLLFDLISRANHSCENNAIFTFSEINFFGALVAMKTIKAGDEITVSYCDVELSYGARQEHLKRKYDFDCRCTKCLREGAE